MRTKTIEEIKEALGSFIHDTCLECIKECYDELIIDRVREIIVEHRVIEPLVQAQLKMHDEEQIRKIMSETCIPMSVAQLSGLTGLSPSAIYQRRHRGQLNFTKKGGRLYMSLTDLNSCLLIFDKTKNGEDDNGELQIGNQCIKD